jgi:hypothetical protein
MDNTKPSSTPAPKLDDPKPPAAKAEMASSQPVSATDVAALINAVEVIINVIRQLSALLPTASGLVGYANQIEHWVKQARGPAPAAVADSKKP